LDIACIDLEKTFPDGMVRNQKHVEKAVEYFKNEKAGALFIPHCNFGTEGAAAMIANELGLPILLWSPRDEAPLKDGSRLRDSLCGTLATSKVLNKLKVPFTYIENCFFDDNKFETGVIDFIRAASVVRSIKNISPHLKRKILIKINIY